MDQYETADEKGLMIESYHRGILRKMVLLSGCIIGIIGTVGLLSVSVCESVSIREAYEIIWTHITGGTYPLRSEEWWADRYIWNRALVHAAAAILAGAGLACCGSLMQSLMNNPLADPYSTGISSGACFGAMAAMIMGVTITSTMGSAGTIVNAFVGAMVPAVIIIVLADRINMTPATLILVGTALSMFFGSLISFMMVSTDTETLQQAYYWQVGNFDNVTWSSIPLMLGITVVGSVIVMFLTRKLNIMSLGDASAQSLGIDVRKFRTLCLTLMAVMTAAIVAFTGILGFIGLVCPHIVRLVTGSDNRFVVPISMALGALLLLLADYAAISLGSLPVGVVMSAIGAPIFFILIVMSKNSGKGAMY